MRFFATAKGCCAAGLFALGMLAVGPVQAQMALNPEVKDQRKVLPGLTEPAARPGAVKGQGGRKARGTARQKRGG